MEITLLNILYIELGYKGLWICLNFNNWLDDNSLELWLSWAVIITIAVIILIIANRKSH